MLGYLDIIHNCYYITLSNSTANNIFARNLQTKNDMPASYILLVL